MPRLSQIMVPGLRVPSDWRMVHDRLLDEFAGVTDVLPTTIPETILIVHEGAADVDRWLDSVSGAILARRRRSRALRLTNRTRAPARLTGSHRGRPGGLAPRHA